MAIGAPELLILLFFIVVPLVLFVGTLIDLLGFDDATWTAVGQNKIVWLLIVLLVGCIGPILYFAMVRPKLKAYQPN